MKQLVLVVGTFYGLTSVILGAFGAHLFKSMLSVEKLHSFETGVRYQMYHALALLIIGFMLPFATTLEKTVGWSFIVGTLFFSLSIYLLAFSEHWNVNLRFLGPVTPLGGLILIIGWTCLMVFFIKGK